MEVLARVVRLVAAHLEAPDVIAVIGPRDEVGSDEIDEIPVDGGAIEAEGRHVGGDLAVRPGRGRARQKLEHSDSRRRFSEA